MSSVAAVPPPSAAAASPSAPARSVIILGAGLTGLTVAYELLLAEEQRDADGKPAAVSSPAASAQGSVLPLHITILESRDRIGGRLLSLPDPDDAVAASPAVAGSPSPSPSSFSSSLDLGASWHWPDNHSRMVSLLQSLGLQSFRGAESERMGGAARVRGGNQRVVHRLWEEIQRMAASTAGSVQLKLGCVCTTIEAAEDGSHATVTTSAGDSYSASLGVVVALPPRLALHSLTFRPALPSRTQAQLNSVPTWMGSSCKIVMRFAEPFWITRGLPDEQGSSDGQRPDDVVFQWLDASSAFEAGVMSAALGSSTTAASSRGPIHVHALFGFARPSCTEAAVTAQLDRAYAPSDFTPPPALSFHAADWSADRFTSASERDGAGGHPRAHPQMRESLWRNDEASPSHPSLPLLLFASSEMAEAEAGYMEGAVRRGRQVAQQLRTSKRWARGSCAVDVK